VNQLSWFLKRIFGKRATKDYVLNMLNHVIWREPDNMSDSSCQKMTEWGVTLEYDLSVKARTEEEAIKKAKQAHGLVTGCNSYLRGVWIIHDSSNENVKDDKK